EQIRTGAIGERRSRASSRGGVSRLSDLDDDDLVESLRSTAGALASRVAETRRRAVRTTGRKRRVARRTAPGTSCCYSLCWHLALFAMLLFMPNPIDPVAYQTAAAAAAVGPLAANDRLGRGRKLACRCRRGPEISSLLGSTLFTGTLDGRIVRVHLPPSSRSCGFASSGQLFVAKVLLSDQMRPAPGPQTASSNRSRLLVADAYLGLIDVNLDKRQFQSIIDRSNPIGVTFFDDLDIHTDGELGVYSEASTRYPLHQLMHQMLEGSSNGRLIMLKYDYATRSHGAGGLSFPNGVAAAPDGQSVLVAETSGFKIIRYYFAGPMAGQTRTFADNLPLGPDNIRLSLGRQALWVSAASPVLAGLRSAGGSDGQRTWLRLAAAKILPGPLLHNMLPAALRLGTAAGLLTMAALLTACTIPRANRLLIVARFRTIMVDYLLELIMARMATLDL
uniref:Str_synth domain-containing protein n=1 Tax=Macrostomum lignano TaxID=282301 RepID=A0A1I8FMX3_9PLAT